MIGLLGTLLAVSHAAADVSVKAHSRSIVGNAIQIKVVVTNPDPTLLEYPDIGNRPWLVHFDTTDPSGARRKLFVTPPPEDSNNTWSLAPGERREVLFDVPTSGSWAAGTATVEIVVNESPVIKRVFELFELKPSHTDADAAPADQTQGPFAELYALDTASGTEVWLGRSGRVDFLARLEGTVRPELSIARADRHIGRWITWTDQNNQLWGIRTHLREIREAPFMIRLPWPKAKACGRAATDAAARLVVPICIDGPDGQSSQLAAAIVSGNKAPTIRPIARFRPATVLTNVDAAGNVDFILIRPNAADIATIEADQKHTRPSRINRLWRGDDTILSSALVMSTSGPAVELKMDTGRTVTIELKRRNHTPSGP